MLSRRTFVSWLSSLGAALGFGVRAREVEAKVEAAAPEQASALDSAMVRGIAEVVLPAELGNDGFARVSRAFTQWVGAYRQGVELVHPYGSTQLRQTAESPAPRWKSQLTALDREARDKHQRGFAALTREQRRGLVMNAFACERGPERPDPDGANYWARELMAR